MKKNVKQNRAVESGISWEKQTHTKAQANKCFVSSPGPSRVLEGNSPTVIFINKQTHTNLLNKREVQQPKSINEGTRVNLSKMSG
jgi:hypothetical protein